MPTTMGKKTQMLGIIVAHGLGLNTLVHSYLCHEKKGDITAQEEHATSGLDSASMRRCWKFLDSTSGTFAPVIKQLDGDLARTICIFYLVLRGLDTIEDDMTIPVEKKQPILRNFHDSTVTPGWNFTENGPDEKDRQLLEKYHFVVEKVNRLAPQYKAIILEICMRMGNGMADKVAKTDTVYFDSVAEYDLYCHYVAGLVGHGVTRILSISGKEAPWLGDQLELANSMGLLMQKANIIFDFREDVEKRRFFWPREIWAKYGFEQMEDLYEKGNVERASWVQSGMILDALRHACDSLDYLRLLKNQSVFVFCAVPATMHMAMLALCFMNPEMFQRKIKVRKVEVAHLIMRSTNMREVALNFRKYARKIRRKAKPQDPNLANISEMCYKIEQWYKQNMTGFS